MSKGLIVLLSVGRLSIKPVEKFEAEWIKQLELQIIETLDSLVNQCDGDIMSVKSTFDDTVKRHMLKFNENPDIPVYFFYAGFTVMKYRNGKFSNIPKEFNKEALDDLKEHIVQGHVDSCDILVTRIGISIRGVPFVIFN